MKKNYISPDIEIIELEFETVLLDGSNPDNEHSIFGDENDDSHSAGSDESL